MDYEVTSDGRTVWVNNVTYPSDTEREVQAGNTHLTEDGKPEGWEQ